MTSSSIYRFRGQRSCDRLQHPFHIAKHVVVPESDDAVSAVRKPLIPNSVSFVSRVLAAIQLKDKSPLTTNKIDDVRAYWFLSNKLMVGQPARPDAVPQLEFSVGGSTSEPPRTIRLDHIGTAHGQAPAQGTQCTASRSLSPLAGRGLG
jgi:hypothetical protein